jgi:hypothetical protein
MGAISSGPRFRNVPRAGELNRGHVVHHLLVRKSVPVASAVFVACLAVAGSHLAVAKARIAGDPPLLVPWSRVGDIALGAPRARVEREYGSAGHGYHVLVRNRDHVQGYYLLHRTKVGVTFDGSRVEEISFSTPYYRTKNGFGVGSTIPLGPCHTTARYRCEHRWHGFVWNEWNRDKPCGCWTKAGLGEQSLPLTTTNFLKPWFFINMRHGRVDGFYFALKFVD